MVSTGGSSLKDDILRLYNTVHIIIATPGRLLDMCQKGVASMSHCSMCCLDEVRAMSVLYHTMQASSDMPLPLAPLTGGQAPVG